MNYGASLLVPGCTASRGEDSYFTPHPASGSIVLLTQITIMMALLCRESGRQKAGNGWESRKGSGEACVAEGSRVKKISALLCESIQGEQIHRLNLHPSYKNMGKASIIEQFNGCRF